MVSTACRTIAGLVIPLLLSVAYTGIVLAFWSGTVGGFGTLADVMKLFTTPEIVLAGWVHYLAFDLFVGAWAHIGVTGRACCELGRRRDHVGTATRMSAVVGDM